MKGWIKLHRKLMKWEWYQDSQTVHLFIHLILRANHNTGQWQGKQVQRGQLITGRKQLSVETGISEKGIRTRLLRLKNSGEINVKTASKFSVITICNYDSYQQDDQQDGQQRASKGPAKGQQRATNKNEKNEKNEKNSNGYSEKFLSFWEEYPKKQGKAVAWKTWKARKLDLISDKIMKSLHDHKQCNQWTKDNGKYIPMGSSWINQERYEDEVNHTPAAPTEEFERTNAAKKLAWEK